jgi:hypothetical protein
MIGGPIEIAIGLTIPVELAVRRARKAKRGREQAAQARVHYWRALQAVMFGLAFAFWMVQATQTWEYAVLAAGIAVALGLALWQVLLHRRVLREPVRAA